MNARKLTVEAAHERLYAILNNLSDHVYDIDLEENKDLIYDLLDGIQIVLDDNSSDDQFGTEGWEWLAQ